MKREVSHLADRWANLGARLQSCSLKLIFSSLLTFLESIRGLFFLGTYQILLFITVLCIKYCALCFDLIIISQDVAEFLFLNL